MEEENQNAVVQDDLEPAQAVEYQSYPHRWGVLGFACILQTMVVASAMTFAILAIAVAQGFEVSLQAAAIATSMQFLVSYPGVILAEKVFGGEGSGFGTRAAYFWASFLLMIGSWVRLSAKADNSYFGWILIGQGILGLGMPMIGHANGAILQDWFNEKERSTAQFFLNESKTLGFLTFFAFSAYYGNRIDNGPEVLKMAFIQDEIYNYIFWQSILNTLVFLVFLFTFSSSTPPTPPEAPMPKKPIVKMNVQMAELFEQKDFVLVTVCFTLIFCANNGTGVWLGMLIAPYGYNAVAASFLGMLYVTTAGISCYIVSHSIKQGTSLYAIRLVCLGAFGYQIFGYLAMSNALWTVLLFFFLAGVLSTPIGPSCNHYAAESTQADYAPGAMGLIAGYVFFVALLVFTAILSPITIEASQNAMLTWSLIGVAALIVSLLMTADSGQPKEEAESESAYKVYPHRWAILGFVCILKIMAVASAMTFAILAIAVADGFGVTLQAAAVCTSMQFLVSYPGVVLAGYLQENYGSRATHFVAALLLVVGSWIRHIITSSFWAESSFVPILVGQAVLGLGIPSIGSGILEGWFPEQERKQAGLLIQESGTLGFILFFSFSAYYGNQLNQNPYNSETQTLQWQTYIVEYIYEYIAWQSILSTIVFVVFLFTFTTAAPPTPPAAQKPKKPEPPMSAVMGALFSNKNFVLALITFTLVFCANNGTGVWLGMLIAPFGYGAVEASFLGIFYVTTAATSCFIVNSFLDGSQKYLFAVRLVCFGAFAYQMYGYLVLSSQQYSVWLFFFLAGLLSVPIGPACHRYAAEVTGPMAGAASGVMNLFAGYVFFGALFLFTATLSPITETSSETTMLIWSMIGAVAFILTLGMSFEEKLAPQGESLIAQEEKI